MLADKIYHDKELASYETEEIVPRYSYTSSERHKTREPIQERQHEKERDSGPLF